jgi:hypothetical protein
MSQENVELVRRGIESVEAFWALLDEDVGQHPGRARDARVRGRRVGLGAAGTGRRGVGARLAAFMVFSVAAVSVRESG